MSINIPQNTFQREYEAHRQAYEEKALAVLRSGWYVLGAEVEAFEREFANYLSVRHCVGLANGLDALIIAFRILGIGKGDEVIVQSNAYIACVMGITINGATPVFVEPDAFHCIAVAKIEEKITANTKAVLAVHLYGQATDMLPLKALCEKHNLKLVEDCAQSHGAMVEDQYTGTIGDIGCFSFYPSKNLGAFGDGGALVTNNEAYAQAACVIRNYGSEKRYHHCTVGLNSRLDEFQAGLLRVRLMYLREIESERRRVAKCYESGIKHPEIIKPTLRVLAPESHVWHQYVVECGRRDELAVYLSAQNIGTIIHYPIPPHLSEAYADLGYQKGDFPIAEHYANTVLSLPLYYGMTDQEQQYVIDAINRFA